jgi:hypothetical protein
MAFITKLLCKTKGFTWTAECQEVWEAIQQRFLDAPILIAPKWDKEFHIHTNASNLAIKAMLAQNPTRKCDQPIAYAYRLLNNVKKNYTTIEKEALAMVYDLHKFRHYVLRNIFVFYVNHMALLYLVKKPQLLGRIVKWLLLFLEYNFLVVYKPRCCHSMADTFS